jgi:hypothetical protein
MKISKKYSKIMFVILFIIIITFIFTKYFLKTDIYQSIDTEKKIIYFGQTLDLENNVVSINYSRGYQLAFEHINRQGGIYGYKLKIILYNDKYEPNLAASNAKLLVDYFNVLALIGPFGTPTTVQILNDCIRGRHIPVIGPFSAGMSYRKIFNKYLILMNGNLYQEFDLTVQHMLKNGIKNVGIIYQNDIYGLAFYNSFIDYVLEKNYPINIISSGNYERNTVELDKCYQNLFHIHNPYDYPKYAHSELLDKMEGVLLFVAEKQIATILGHLKRVKPSLFTYYNFFVGTSPDNYKDIQKYSSENLYQTLLTPTELEKNYPQLHKAFDYEKKLYNQKTKSKITYNTQSLYQGFYTGLMIGEVLKQFKDPSKITRESFTDMFYQIKNFNIYGLKIGPFINNVSNLGIQFSSINKVENNKLVTIYQKNELPKSKHII